MTSETKTPFEIKCEILGELWMDYRESEEFKDFIEFNDLGLPLAYATAQGMIDPQTIGKQMIEDSFKILLAGLEYEDDLGWETLTDLLNG